MAEATRMRELLTKFEGRKEPSPPPSKERLQSTLDAPRAELSSEARSARVQSISMMKEANKTETVPRYVPKIGPTDADDIRDLKRQIQGKEQEIIELSSKLLEISDRLDRVVQIFNSSLLQAAEASVEIAPAGRRASPTKAFDVKADAPQTTSRPKSAPSAAGTSLEAILAAARSGGPRGGSGKPKYSKMLRDMK